MHVSPPLQLILIHCPGEIAAEMDALCRRNFMRRTDFMIMAARSLLEQMESAAARETKRLRRQLLDGEGLILFPGELPEELTGDIPEACPGEESSLYPEEYEHMEESTCPGEDDYPEEYGHTEEITCPEEDGYPEEGSCPGEDDYPEEGTYPDEDDSLLYAAEEEE